VLTIVSHAPGPSHPPIESGSGKKVGGRCASLDATRMEAGSAGGGTREAPAPLREAGRRGRPGRIAPSRPSIILVMDILASLIATMSQQAGGILVSGP
jgi:hypothetical protein